MNESDLIVAPNRFEVVGRFFRYTQVFGGDRLVIVGLVILTLSHFRLDLFFEFSQLD